jgi:hypothetical protein
MGVMRGAAKGSTRIWRRVVGCILAYALALQGIGYALASTQIIGQIAGDDSWPGYELCRGDTSAAEASGNIPHNPTGNYHCFYCIAGGNHLLGAPPFHPGVVAVAFVVVTWPFTPWQISTLNVYSGSRARGPPVVA